MKKIIKPLKSRVRFPSLSKVFKPHFNLMMKNIQFICLGRIYIQSYHMVHIIIWAISSYRPYDLKKVISLVIELLKRRSV